MSAERFRCAKHPGAPTYRVGNGVRGGVRQTKKRCALCHEARGPQGVTPEGACVRCGSTEIRWVTHRNGRKYRRCKACERAWARDARRKNPEPSRRIAAQYAASCGFYEPTTLSLDEDPWEVNARRLEDALGRAMSGPARPAPARATRDPWDVLLGSGA